MRSPAGLGSLLFGIALVVASVLPASALGTPASRSFAQSATGATLLILAGTVEVAVGLQGFFAPALDGQAVNAGDRVRTDPSGVALLTFFDGSETQLGPESEILLERAEASSVGAGISLAQAAGTTVNRVRQGSSGALQTTTPASVALVRGTTYVVKVTPVGQLGGQLSAALSPVGASGPRYIEGIPYPLIGEATYREGNALWQVRTWQDPADGATWETFEPIGSASTSLGGGQHLAALGARALPAAQEATPAECAPGQDFLVAQALLMDPDGHLGTVDVTPRFGGPTVRLQQRGDLGVSSCERTFSGRLTAAAVQLWENAVRDLRDPAGALELDLLTDLLQQEIIAAALLTPPQLELGVQPAPTVAPTSALPTPPPPTSTPLIPTSTPVPPTATRVPATPVPPTSTPVPVPTERPGEPGGDPAAQELPPPPPTSTPVPTPTATLPPIQAGTCSGGSSATGGSPALTNYAVSDNGSIGGASFNWVDATGGVRVSGLDSVDDQCAGPVTLPFQFPFYGQTFNTVYIDSNGLLSFTNGTANYSNTSIPTGGSNPVNGPWLAPLWDDIDSRCLTNDGIYYQPFSSYVVFEWLNWQHYACSSAPSGEQYTFQAILYADGTVVFQYLTMNDPGQRISASIGLQNQDGTLGVHYAYNSSTGISNTPPAGRAVRFVPSGTVTPTPTATPTPTFTPTPTPTATPTPTPTSTPTPTPTVIFVL